MLILVLKIKYYILVVPGYGKKIHGAEEMTYVFESVRAKNSLFFGSSDSKEDVVRMAHMIQPNMVAINIC